MLLLIILLVLLFGGGGGYYGYSRWGAGGGLGMVGTILLIVLVIYLFGGLRLCRTAQRRIRILWRRVTIGSNAGALVAMFGETSGRWRQDRR